MRRLVSTTILLISISGCYTAPDFKGPSHLENFGIGLLVNILTESDYPSAEDPPKRAPIKPIDMDNVPLASNRDCTRFKSLSSSWYACHHKK